MPNRRYLAWLITAAYAATHGGFRAPDDVILLGPGADAEDTARAAEDATKTSHTGHRVITSGR